ncbi:glycoside hydrolase family 5 protein [Jaapia argillacea MUCL 33604]|uniref:cellulase n=1 Tax=Jaapia argillacea MUCL 33604 TaxID=933084 RepID=A0A067PXW8_9AGAM|nr:glycoside hydrolase family 5 protein [Jaapia argillacea MUCL 33604]
MKTLVALGFVGFSALSSSITGGGTGWTGATTCVSGSTCTVLNAYYSQCLPSSTTGGTSHTTSSTSHTSSGTSTSSHTSTGTSSSASATSTGKVKFVGVNIAGFDFGCGTDGSDTLTSIYPPLTALGGPDGAGQMQHFVSEGYNIFRLPVGWQYLVNNNLGGALDATNSGKYDQLVQACLATGAYCIIDIHNYARWNGGIIGQGGPTNAQFASLWSNIATKYKSQSKVVFGVMNEPHDVPDINLWAGSVQAAVTAIRQAGATTQMILLPGNNWTSAQTFISNGSGAALLTVTNPDGTTTNLIFDVHKYLDSDNSGTNAECVTDNVSSSWQPLAAWLRSNGRQALNTETGGGNTASCVQYMCSQVAYMKQNSDVILGYVGWAAGAFATSYVLSEVPTRSGSTWTDTLLVSSCMKP